MLIVLILEIFYAFGFVYGCCEIGELLCASFNEISDGINQLNWYLFPIETKQMLCTLYNHAHRPSSGRSQMLWKYFMPSRIIQTGSSAKKCLFYYRLQVSYNVFVYG